MQALAQASLLKSVIRWFRPAPLTVQLNSTVLANGDIGLEPVFILDGQRVDPSLIRDEGRQRILGYTVRLEGASADVLRRTGGKPVRVVKSRAAEFLERLATQRVSIRTRDGAHPVDIKRAHPDVTLTLGADDSLVVESTLVTRDGLVVGKPMSMEQLKSDDGWHNDGQDFIRVETTGTALDQILVQEGGNGRLSAENVPRFLEALEAKKSQVGQIERSSNLQPLEVFSGTPIHRADVIGDAEGIRVAPRLEYKSAAGRSYRRELAPAEATAKGQARYQRVNEGWLKVDGEGEAAFCNAAKSLADHTNQGGVITGCDIPEALKKLQEAAAGRGPLGPWNVFHTREVAASHKLVEEPGAAEFRVGIVDGAGQSLLQLDPMYRHERFQVRHDEAIAALKSGKGWVRRDSAWVRADRERVAKVEAAASELGLRRSGSGYAFNAAQRDRVIQLFSTLGSIRQTEAYAEFLLKLQDFSRIEEVPLPVNMKADVVLRAYQHHGLNWLAFMQRFGLNGILADDMGLGKTLQTLAAVERAREVTGSQLPVLIICPTSVMLNWRSEIGKFLVRSRTIVWHGAGRHAHLVRIEEQVALAKHDGCGMYVVTSFDCARLDHDMLNRVPWLYVVVDESHNIKNPDAQRTKAIKTIPGQHKLALTGTPIQNKLEELWSLFDFTMPGFLGTRAAFRNAYTTNSRINDDAVATTLVPRVHPFVLRRLKSTVARDLPEKIIVHRDVPLTPLQVQAYRDVTRSAEFRKMAEAVNTVGVAKANIHILAALAKLRNICNHPALTDREVVAPCSALPKDSGKLDSLQELLEEIEEGDHRALLFSQSTAMLDIIQHWCGQWGVTWLRIDGSTPATQRAGRAERFNKDLSIRCFLLSTKAAGTGLNLTGADTVIFYDHDWNPANDAQAMDRAYRIGQTRNVTVYKLVSKGTLEEKILERQAAKQKLADQVIGADEGGFKDLSREELLDLFRFNEQGE